LHRLRTEQFDFGLSAVHIYLDLFDAFHLIGGHFSLLKEILQIIEGYPSEVVLDHVIIFFTLPLEGVFLYLLVIRNVV
jgi:hypothetical protein